MSATISAPPRAGALRARRSPPSLDLLARNGAEGYGQSSWGPTGFVLAATLAEAKRWQRLAAPLAESSGLELMIVKGRGHGAVVAGPARAGRQGVRHG